MVAEAERNRAFVTPIAARLNELLAECDESRLEEEVAEKFSAYFDLLAKWNARLNLTSIRNPDDILQRHFVESIACARMLPNDLSSVLDFGSGAGFPGVPIALCRPELAVMLVESQSKKAAFLREVARSLPISVQVFEGRGETLPEMSAECVVMRAVDKMQAAVGVAISLLAVGGLLGLVSTVEEAADLALVHSGMRWEGPRPLPFSKRRVLLMGVKPVFHVEQIAGSRAR